MKRKLLTLICSLTVMMFFAGCSFFNPIEYSTGSNFQEQESSNDLPGSNDDSSSDDDPSSDDDSSSSDSANGGNWTGEAPLN